MNNFTTRSFVISLIIEYENSITTILYDSQYLRYNIFHRNFVEFDDISKNYKIHRDR